LLLLRHGEIAANVRRRWHGATDSPLTPAGRRQAQRLALRIQKDWGDVEAIYTSPLIRCLHTAQRVGAALGQEVILEDDLREWGIGELEDTTFEALHSEHDFFRRIRDDQNFAPHGGDTVNAPCGEFTQTTTQRGRLRSLVTAPRSESRWRPYSTPTQAGGRTITSTTAA
jgi:broad specificity phosphatase PhoE